MPNNIKIKHLKKIGILCLVGLIIVGVLFGLNTYEFGKFDIIKQIEYDKKIIFENKTYTMTEGNQTIDTIKIITIIDNIYKTGTKK